MSKDYVFHKYTRGVLTEDEVLRIYEHLGYDGVDFIEDWNDYEASTECYIITEFCFQNKIPVEKASDLCLDCCISHIEEDELPF